jgi:hypothetical protein
MKVGRYYINEIVPQRPPSGQSTEGSIVSATLNIKVRTCAQCSRVFSDKFLQFDKPVEFVDSLFQQLLFEIQIENISKYLRVITWTYESYSQQIGIFTHFSKLLHKLQHYVLPDLRNKPN